MSENNKQFLFTAKTTWVLLGLITLLIAALLLASLWLYSGKRTPAKDKIFSKLPLPVALINTKIISSKDFYQRIAIAQSVLKQTNTKADQIDQDILEQLIENKKIELLLNKRSITVNTEELDQAYRSLYQQLPGADEQSFKEELEKTYGLEVSQLKTDILTPALQKELLSKWYNSQESFNQESYQKGRDLLNQLDTGSSFEDVANKYNQDQGSMPFAGDQGFIAEADLLPEFQEVLSSMAVGDKKLIPSRYGLHILKLNGIEEEEAGKSYSLQQIFIVPGDFQGWLQKELKNITSYKLL